MSQHPGRFTAAQSASVAEGWQLERLTPPSRLFGANGLRTGRDGRLYVAQVSGSQVSAIDVDSGAIEVISPKGGDIVAPDDIAFDDDGNLYATEITEGRIGMLGRDGRYRVISADVPVANPITFHQGRLIVGECRPGGRIMELDRNDGRARIIASDVPMPNAFSVGPDGKLYFPVMGANEIWRIDLAGGAPEKVAGDLGVPDSVKFDAQGSIVSTQVASGQVLRIDPHSGERTLLAQLSPGLDNCSFVGERLFVSNISGYIVEVLKDGGSRDLVPDGFNWPLGLATDIDGSIYVADGAFSWRLRADGSREPLGHLFAPGYPGYSRGVVCSGAGEFVITTANGEVARYRPGQPSSEVLASGFDQLYGIAIAPGGALVVAELGGGRVLAINNGTVETLATGLRQPTGVAVGTDGTVYISESAGGRVVRLARGKAETVIDGLQQPQGLLVHDGALLVLDAGRKELIRLNLGTGAREVLAARLPVGAPAGVVPKTLGAIGNLSGPMGPFAGIATSTDGTLYLSSDAEGSVLALRRRD